MKVKSSTLFINGLKDCFSKYYVALLIGLVLLLAASKSSAFVQNILCSIAASLFALPIIFMSIDIHQLIKTKKQREMVTHQINSKVQNLFTNFIFMTNKFRAPFETATDGSPSFLKLRCSSVDEIFNDISSNEHHGFFIFSHLDNFCQQINELLESNLFLAYTPNEIISLLSQFSLKYQELLDEFSLISKDDFIHIDSDSNLDFELSKNTCSNYPVYAIKKRKNGESHVLYLAGYPLFDSQMLRGIYRISGTKAQTLSKLIFELYTIIKNWEKVCSTNLEAELDNVFVASGRLTQCPQINAYAEKNMSISIEWP